jgi:hypothetical protein
VFRFGRKLKVMEKVAARVTAESHVVRARTLLNQFNEIFVRDYLICKQDAARTFDDSRYVWGRGDGFRRQRDAFLTALEHLYEEYLTVGVVSLVIPILLERECVCVCVSVC